MISSSASSSYSKKPALLVPDCMEALKF